MTFHSASEYLVEIVEFYETGKWRPETERKLQDMQKRIFERTAAWHEQAGIQELSTSSDVSDDLGDEYLPDWEMGA